MRHISEIKEQIKYYDGTNSEIMEQDSSLNLNGNIPDYVETEINQNQDVEMGHNTNDLVRQANLLSHMQCKKIRTIYVLLLLLYDYFTCILNFIYNVIIV
jgi:hypothetical protein